MTLGLTYFKRFRMELDLVGRQFAAPTLGPPYRILAWEDSLLDAHAEAKYLSFRDEIDSSVFACLGDLIGCQRLMQEIRQKDGFLPGATWLAVHEPPGSQQPEYCGTIQGIRDHNGVGAIQNLGVVPEHRNRGVGKALLQAALIGFQRAGLRRSFLEVTAQNDGAIRLYQQVGFTKARTVYKAVEVAYS